MQAVIICVKFISRKSMIKVTLFETTEMIEKGHTYYVDTSCFIKANRKAKAKAEAVGVDLKRYSNSAMALIDVLKP